MSQVEDILSTQPAAPAAARAVGRSLYWSMPWAVMVAVVVVAAHLPLLILHCQHLLDLVQYGFFPLIPVGAFFLAQQRLRGVGQLTPGNRVVFSLLLGFAFLLAAFGVLVFSPKCGAIAFLFALFACTYGIGGWLCVARVLPAWLFMWFIIPLPFNLDQQLINSLQGITAQWSSRLLDVTRILHVLNGNTVEIPGHKLLVEEACSGVRSLFVILAFTAFFALFFRVGLVRGVLLMAGSVLFVVIANVVRVVLITGLTLKGFSVVEGLPHELLGIGVFLFAMGMVLSYDRLLMFILPPKTFWHKARTELARAADGVVLWPRWQSTWLASWPSLPAMVLYAGLVGAQLYLLWPSRTLAEAQAQAAAQLDQRTSQAFDKLSADQLPDKWNGWRRLDFVTKSRPRFDAQFSRYWAYRAGGDKMVTSIDYPFMDWHDLLICYQAVGWSIKDRTPHGPDVEPEAPFFEVNLNQSNMQYGYLLFYLFDAEGRPLEPRTFTVAEKILDRVEGIQDNWRTASQNLAAGKRKEYYQFQVFIESYTPFTDEERQQAREFYRLACQKLRTQWLPDVPHAADDQQP
ncbi:MAG TPA: exosortase U [Pirellulales bacterium]